MFGEIWSILWKVLVAPRSDMFHVPCSYPFVPTNDHTFICVCLPLSSLYIPFSFPCDLHVIIIYFSHLSMLILLPTPFHYLIRFGAFLSQFLLSYILLKFEQIYYSHLFFNIQTKRFILLYNK